MQEGNDYSNNFNKLFGIYKRDKNWSYWSVNRNKTQFTELWEKRDDENFEGFFKENFCIYPNTF